MNQQELDKRPSLDDFKRNTSQQEEFVKEYDRLKPEFGMTSQSIMSRKKVKVLTWKYIRSKLNLWLG